MSAFYAEVADLPAGLSIRETLARVSMRLSGLPTDFAAEARMLVCAATRIDRLEFLRNPDRPIDDESLARLRPMLQRRLAREPVTRIIGRRDFWSLDLEVAPSVLDPRGDTETLVEVALRLLADRVREPLRILDLGTGSGAILCALLSELPNAVGLGVDVSSEACEASRRNLEGCGLEARGAIVRVSWADAIEGRFDLIVSNPPYIESDVIPTLDPEVCAYDPILALDGGPDGLDAYRVIAGRLPDLVKPGSLVIFEIGATQADAVVDTMRPTGMTNIGRWRDLGGNDRVLAFGSR